MANVVDLEDIVKTWAWTNFLKVRSKENSKLRLEDVQMNVNWSRVRFVTEKPVYEDKNMEKIPKAQVVFRSTYHNNTENEQEHSFQTERTTSCVSTTSMEKGFTKGFNVELKLGLPEEVAEITAGFGREVNMQTGFEDTCENSLTWAVNSTIRVKGNHSATADLEVRENDFSAKYKMLVKIRGIVIVSLTNLKDNNSFIQSFEGDFSQIMKDEQKKGTTGFTIEERTVHWVVEGNCSFRFGVEQQIKLKEEPLNN
ncbi:uncharacterized protein LOC134236590 [Saccostrea cucullata]|uniref:uncharacterized protein LOC134236590 n=1 Tax=Saccostrea cuccullata TaxID=36930 RepID=UPI002ED00D2D